MGMFDYVHFEMRCPVCGRLLDGFQTKDGECLLDKVEPDGLTTFYTMCRCDTWIEFRRRSPPFNLLREKPLTLPEVEALGFTMHVSRPLRNDCEVLPPDPPEQKFQRVEISGGDLGGDEDGDLRI